MQYIVITNKDVDQDIFVNWLANICDIDENYINLPQFYLVSGWASEIDDITHNENVFKIIPSEKQFTLDNIEYLFYELVKKIDNIISKDKTLAEVSINVLYSLITPPKQKSFLEKLKFWRKL